MKPSENDRRILRDLAKRVAEIASQPVMEVRRREWKRHNALGRGRALVLVFPEGAWRELLPEASLRCETRATREMETELRKRVYYHEHFADDTVIEREWIVHKAISDSGWGLQAEHVEKVEELGSWTFKPVMHERSDLKKIRAPGVFHDEKRSARELEEAQELLGDILDVRQKGMPRVTFHLMAQYTGWRGLQETAMDMIQEPEWVHEGMRILEEAHHRRVQQLVDLNLLSLNNDATYNSSGGNGYTDELPAPGFDPDRVRLCDMWGSAESQQMAMVSPAMHAEFALAYEKRLLEPFGLTGYGCCEDLSRKLDDVLTIPHIRRISISPWADVEVSAKRLRGDTIFSWKPNPSHLVGEFSEERVREYVRHTLQVATANGCVLEIILKDTHTCENHPERFDRWTRVVRTLVDSR
jgi:hypothetical protein